MITENKSITLNPLSSDQVKPDIPASIAYAIPLGLCPYYSLAVFWNLNTKKEGWMRFPAQTQISKHK